MKLLRVGAPGAEKPALLDASGVFRDLSGIVHDIDGPALSPASLSKLAALDPASLPTLDAGQRVGACVVRPTNFICIGLNYADHAAETGSPIPKEPIVFLKSLGAFSGPNDDVKIPRGSKKTDWEVELGIVIGSTASYVTEEQAMDHVAGYCVVNDVSEREFQIERGGTWDKGKGCDTFGPRYLQFRSRRRQIPPQHRRLRLPGPNPLAQSIQLVRHRQQPPTHDRPSQPPQHPTAPPNRPGRNAASNRGGIIWEPVWKRALGEERRRLAPAQRALSSGLSRMVHLPDLPQQRERSERPRPHHPGPPRSRRRPQHPLDHVETKPAHRTSAAHTPPNPLPATPTAAAAGMAITPPHRRLQRPPPTG